jgi:hypothetical protein
MTFAPLENLLAGARWLGAPFVILVKYLWDPDAVGLVPGGPLRSASAGIAHVVSQHWPDMGTRVMPYALFGALGMLALIVASIGRLRAREAAAPMQAAGFGIAWFGIGAAGIVSLSRLAYFHEFPGQIYADRYLPWPCLFWLGLALIALGRLQPQRQWLSRATLGFALILPLLGWPLQFGGSIYAAIVRAGIDDVALGSAVGVIDRATALGETVGDELTRGVPVLRPLHVAQFSDPALQWLGQTAATATRTLNGATIDTKRVSDNLLGEPGTAVRVQLAEPQPAHELLLIDANAQVVGLIVRDGSSPAAYTGYARGLHVPADLRVAQIP